MSKRKPQKKVTQAEREAEARKIFLAFCVAMGRNERGLWKTYHLTVREMHVVFATAIFTLRPEYKGIAKSHLRLRRDGTCEAVTAMGLKPKSKFPPFSQFERDGESMRAYERWPEKVALMSSGHMAIENSDVRKMVQKRSAATT